MKRLALVTALLALAHAPVHADSAVGRVTWYAPTGNAGADGTMPVTGTTAACGWAIPMHSTVTLPDGSSYLCTDTGALGAYDVDVFNDPSTPARMAPYCWGPYGNTCPVEVSP